MAQLPGPSPASPDPPAAPMSSTPILLATGNPDKQAEFRRIIEGLPFTPVTPDEAGISSTPEETGDTHEAIARDKAAQWSAAASMLAIASDGGLVIPTLGPRWESRCTHRFAGPAADNNERLARLLQLMRPFRGEERQAWWVEALAFAKSGRILASWELQGGTGCLDEYPPDGPLPEFWVFSVWRFPQFGAAYSHLSARQRESVDGHWERLRLLARRFLTSTFVAR